MLCSNHSISVMNMSTTILKGCEKMCNAEIKEMAKTNKVPLWKIADKFGITDSHFSRKLRKEFSPEDKQKALDFIKQIAAEN